jgi:hypothetical protein
LEGSVARDGLIELRMGVGCADGWQRSNSRHERFR